MSKSGHRASRRAFVKQGGAVTATGLAGAALPATAGAATALLDTRSIRQFVNVLPNPLDPANLAQPDFWGSLSYTLTIRETQQDLGLAPGGALRTTVWGYGSGNAPASYPGPTFEVNQYWPITVQYVNALRTASGAPLPNRMPVDTTLDWANPGGLGGLAPVPVVAHLHGGGSASRSDGLPDAWSTPGDAYQGRLFSRPYQYDNRQESGHLWYHDHALGITRTNVYMGLAGLYFVRDANENWLRVANVLPRHPYEVPLVIQDRSFTADGKLYYPAEGDVPGLPMPTHLPEFFGDVVLVNGKAWPRLDVERRKYRLRILNGSDSRFYNLRLVTSNGAPVPRMMVLGTELGLLDAPVVPAVSGWSGLLSIAPGERYDVLIDFGAVPMGTRVMLANSAPAPYPGGDDVVPGLTDRVMAFDVVKARSWIPDATVDLGTDLRRLVPPLPKANTAGLTRRRILMYEGTDRFGRLQTMLGTVDRVGGQQGTMTFKDPITETPAVNTKEVWEFYNTTGDAHPMHMHLVDFRVLNRQPFSATLDAKSNTDGSDGALLRPESIAFTGAARPAAAWEVGRKDTVQTFPGEVTRVLVNFSRAGEYVYHCHILSHEDHEMMRPYKVV